MNRRRIDRDEQEAKAGARVRSVGAALARVVGSLAITALVVYGALASWAWLRTAERLQVRTIEFQGLVHAEAAELERRALLLRGTNIFSTDLSAAARAMEEDPWVAHARVARHLPGTLKVAIDERTAVALVSLGGLYASDSQGTLFKRVLAADGLDLPVITGLSREVFAGEHRVGDEALRTALRLVEAYAAHPMAERAPLAELNVGEQSGEPDFTAWVGDEPVEVKLGVVHSGEEGDVSNHLGRLVRVWDELERRGARAKTIDLGNRQRPDWVAAWLE